MKSGSLIQSLMKVFLIIAVAGGMCGCRNKHQEKLEMALEKSTAIKDDQNADGQNVTIETEGNRVEIQGEHASWPEEMPRDVPEFTYGTLKNLTMTQTPESRSWTILADHIPENVIREYEERLKTSGFKTSSMILSSSGSQEGSVTAQKEAISIAMIASKGTATLSVAVRK